MASVRLLPVLVAVMVLATLLADLPAPVASAAQSASSRAALRSSDQSEPRQSAEPAQEVSGSDIRALTTRPQAGALLPRVPDLGPAPIRKPGAPDPVPTTDHFIVVDGASGAVLSESHGYDPVAPASTTKVMTAILGVEYGKLDEKVQVDVNAGDMAGSSLMGLEPWFDVTVRDLLYGLILVSGNDAALAIARYVSGSDENFVRLMNQKAGWLGLRATHFANPHGLDTSDHYSSPYDMVVMARYGMQYPAFRSVVAARTYEVNGSNIALELHNINPFLTYPGADGVKTGLTDSAGRALVGTAVENGHRVYVAFMRSEAGASTDGAYLLGWAFRSFDWPDIKVEASR